MKIRGFLDFRSAKKYYHKLLIEHQQSIMVAVHANLTEATSSQSLIGTIKDIEGTSRMCFIQYHQKADIKPNLLEVSRMSPETVKWNCMCGVIWAWVWSERRGLWQMMTEQRWIVQWNPFVVHGNLLGCVWFWETSNLGRKYDYCLFLYSPQTQPMCSMVEMGPETTQLPDRFSRSSQLRHSMLTCYAGLHFVPLSLLYQFMNSTGSSGATIL